MAKITIRMADEKDIPHLQDIERSAARLFKQIPELAWLASGSVQTIERHRQLTKIGSNWVATDFSGKIAGFLSAEPLENDLHIWELSVDSSQQSQGVGTALLDYAIGQARIRALSRVTLTTFRHVPWNAPFYAKRGFSILTEETLDNRLSKILDMEGHHSLPRHKRCAMSAAIDIKTE